jgi:L-amino acid N-acyltransferase YncA
VIRTARAQDAPAITALWNQIIADTTITFTTVLKTEAEVAEIIADAGRLAHVAYSKDAFAGFALVSPFRGGPGYAHTVEHTVYLYNDAQGLGFGTDLIGTLQTASIVAGHHVMVGAISGSNFGAIEFHKRAGFQQVGHLSQAGRKNGEWQDLVLMQKILQNGH